MKLCVSCKNGLFGNPNICSVCGADISSIQEVAYDGLVGMTIQGKYEFVSFLGEGAMGCVYRAVHTALQRSVAVKLMKSLEVNETEVRNRFEREARAASRLNHPHVVSVVDFGTTEGGFLYLITEYVEGQTLFQLLDETPILPLSRVFVIFFDILAAMEEAHNAHIIHRDLKPENILVNRLRTGEDFIKVLDFGVASLADDQSAKITLAGTCVGTPGYIAPEHIRGDEATERSDIYALGTILYQMLAGTPAYGGGNATKILTDQLTHDPPPLREVAKRDDISPHLELLVMKAMARAPEERFQTITEFATALSEILSEMELESTEKNSLGAMPVYKQFTGKYQIKTLGMYSIPPPAARSFELRNTEPSAPPFSSPTAEQATITTSKQARNIALRTAIIGENDIVGWSDVVDRLVHFMTGKPIFLDVCGPEGAGKSAIAKSAIRCADLLDFVVYRTTPDPWLAKTPWYPVRQLVGQIIGCGTDPKNADTISEAATQCPNLNRTDLTALYQLFGYGPHDMLNETTTSRSESLYPSIAKVILQSNSHLCLCLLLEDATAYDRASLKFFRHLIETDEHHEFLKIIATTDGGLYPAQKKRRLQLPPLENKSVSLLLQKHIHNPTLRTPELAKRITTVSRGNPLHAMQLIRSIDEGGDIHKTLEETLEARLSRLTTETRRVYECICVLGRAVSTDLLDELLQDDQLFLELEWLRIAGWIKVDGDRSIAPTHPTIAHLVREMMPRDTLQSLHQKIVTVLEQKKLPVFVLAYHAWEGKMAATAVDLLEKAGDAALAWFDEEQAALEYYKRATHITRWDLLKGEDDPDYLALQLKLGKALKQSGHLVSAKMVLKEVVANSGRFPEIKNDACQTLA